VPRIGGRKQRVGLFDGEKEGKGSDASSVRRYRVDLDDGEEGEGDHGGGGNGVGGLRLGQGGRRGVSGWGCWGIGRGGGEKGGS